MIIVSALILTPLGYWGWPKHAHKTPETSAPTPSRTAGRAPAAGGSTGLEWQKIVRDSAAFRVEMPGAVRDLEAPAYTEAGTIRPISMISSVGSADFTFSVAWQDRPPVAASRQLSPAKTLAVSERGAMDRTQTTLVTDSGETTQGFPSRTFESRNTSGGLLVAKLIYAGPRLYLLTATFRSASVRKEEDVRRFFYSFAITAPPGAQNESRGD